MNYIKILSISILICLMPILSLAGDKWTQEDTAYQAVFITALSCDWLQTKEIARNPNYYETNFILGKYPSQNEVDFYLLSAAILHTGIAYYLPKEYRRIWQCFWIGVEMNCVRHNYSSGIRINF